MKLLVGAIDQKILAICIPQKGEGFALLHTLLGSAVGVLEISSNQIYLS
jgi:hypothetical protein